MLEKQQTPVRLQYGGQGGVMDLVKLSMARTLYLDDSMEADSFHELVMQHPEHVHTVEQRGAEFDLAFRSFILTVMAVRKKVEIHAKEDEGLFGSDYFPWHDTLVRNLEQRGRAKDFRLVVIREQLGSAAAKQLIAV